jgi:hypothetical protein
VPIFISVFRPRALVKVPAYWNFVIRRGWILIVARWLYYSVLFLLRDYHGRWAPFTPPPFGLETDTYAFLQRSLSLPFGLALMCLLALSLALFFRLRGREIGFIPILNVLGVAFFLPFVIVQPIDQLILALFGWTLLPVAIVHTAVLIWESWIALTLLSLKTKIGWSDRLAGASILTFAWIVVAGVLWR